MTATLQDHGHDEHARLLALAYDVHEQARMNTKAKSYVVGSIMRGIANRILFELGENTIPYEGPPVGDGTDEALS